MIKLFVLILLTSLLFAPAPAYAQYNPTCPSVYGAKCPTGTLAIDKKVKNPQTGELVESLSANDATFLPGQEVNFRIEVKNIGKDGLSNIQVQDKFPDFLNYVAGPGKFDQNSHTLSWSIDHLNPGEFKLFDVKGTVADASKFPGNGVTCLTNFSQSQANNQVAQDTAVFCVQTKVLGTATELPKTGPRETAMVMTMSLWALFMSVYLFRKQLS